MPAVTLTAKGQVVIPAEIRRRHALTAGTQVEFVDEDGAIRLLVHRRALPTEAADGYGMIRVAPAPKGQTRSLADFDAAAFAGDRGRRSGRR